MVLPLKQYLFLLTGRVFICCWVTPSRSLLVIHQSRVTFSSPDVTSAWEYLVCFYYLWLFTVLSLRAGRISSQLARVTMWDRWVEWRMGEWRLYDRDSCSGPLPAVGSVNQWTALGSVHCCLRDEWLNPSCYTHKQNKNVAAAFHPIIKLSKGILVVIDI